MASVRYFSGGRDSGKKSIASEIMRIEVMKKGKLPSADRFKIILKKRFEENKKKALGDRVKVGFKVPGSFKEARQMSKRAEEALKQMAMKKANKEAKALRRMVIVTPRVYPNGNLTKKGKIYDVAGNIVAEVNLKNGKMQTMLGWSFGKYRPQSAMTNVTIQNAINQYSPYFINMRKMQALQQHGSATSWGDGSDVVNVYGGNHGGQHGMAKYYGSDVQGPRQDIGVTAWGATSDNVWGTYADNAWGNSMDNVWGGNSSDVWGGIGPGGLWGAKGQHIWGTGSGKNLIKGLTSRVAAFFGLKGGGTVHDEKNGNRNSQRLSAHEAAVFRSSGAAHETSTRSSAAHEHASTTRAPTTRK